MAISSKLSNVIIKIEDPTVIAIILGVVFACLLITNVITFTENVTNQILSYLIPLSLTLAALIPVIFTLKCNDLSKKINITDKVSKESLIKFRNTFRAIIKKILVYSGLLIVLQLFSMIQFKSTFSLDLNSIKSIVLMILLLYLIVILKDLYYFIYDCTALPLNTTINASVRHCKPRVIAVLRPKSTKGFPWRKKQFK